MASVDYYDRLNPSIEVRLWSHLRFEEDSEPSRDGDVHELASSFSEPFGNYLREQTGATTGRYFVVNARRTSGGVGRRAIVPIA